MSLLQVAPNVIRCVSAVLVTSALTLTAGHLVAQGAASVPPTAHVQSGKGVHVARHPSYTITPLGMDAVSLDDTGRVAFNDGTLAFIFAPSLPNSPAGTLSPVGTFGGSVSNGKGISQYGFVVGDSTLKNGQDHAFMSHPNGLVDIGSLGGDFTCGTAIDACGRVAGCGNDAAGHEHAFLWSPFVALGEAGTMADLGTLGGDFSAALGMNDIAAIVGVSSTANGELHAFHSWSGTMQDLGTLGGSSSRADAINDYDWVVGQASLPGNAEAHATLWIAGHPTDLGTLGGQFSEAFSIDTMGGMIVGESDLPNEGGLPQHHAFLWTSAGMMDLNHFLPADSGWVLESASGVNGLGQIVGHGTFHGQARGFLLTPKH